MEAPFLNPVELFNLADNSFPNPEIKKESSEEQPVQQQHQHVQQQQQIQPPQQQQIQPPQQQQHQPLHPEQQQQMNTTQLQQQQEQDQAIQNALKESLNDTLQQKTEEPETATNEEPDYMDDDEDDDDEDFNPDDDQENEPVKKKKRSRSSRKDKESPKPMGLKPLKGIFEITQLYHNKHWKCRACDFTSRAKDQALKHLKKVHMKQKKIYPRTKYPCKICGREYWKEVGRDNHMQKVHNVDFDLKVKDGSKIVKKEAPAGTFPCTKCAEPFKNEKSLQDHLPHCLIELECNICGTVFERGQTLASKFKASFQRHQKNCRRLKIYNRNCPYCDKYFARPYQCRRHIPTCKVRKSGGAKKKQGGGGGGEDDGLDDFVDDDDEKEDKDDDDEEDDDEPEEEFEDTPDTDDDD